ncbi:MAG: hypothetical protein ACP5MD_00515 [Verrucomicrobiia bacterium]
MTQSMLQIAMRFYCKVELPFVELDFDPLEHGCFRWPFLCSSFICQRGNLNRAGACAYPGVAGEIAGLGVETAFLVMQHGLVPIGHQNAEGPMPAQRSHGISRKSNYSLHNGHKPA